MPEGDEMPFSKLEVKLKEPTLIFPASPTTKHVYFLTNLDQNIDRGEHALSLLLQRPEDKKFEDPASVLKEALGKLLVEFYPMAGRLGISLEGKLQVECEDQGVVSVDATTENCLADPGGLSSPAPFMPQLVYDAPSAKNVLEMSPFIVRVTTFKCRGFGFATTTA